MESESYKFYKAYKWQNEKNSQWYWHIKARNGKILCQAGGFNTSQLCNENFDLVRKFFQAGMMHSDMRLRLTDITEKRRAKSEKSRVDI